MGYTLLSAPTGFTTTRRDGPVADFVAAPGSASSLTCGVAGKVVIVISAQSWLEGKRLTARGTKSPDL